MFCIIELARFIRTKWPFHIGIVLLFTHASLGIELRSHSNKEFPIPIKFDPQFSQGMFANSYLTFNLQQKEILQLGFVEISSKSLELSLVAHTKDAANLLLLVNFPGELFEEPDLELRGSMGSVLWSMELDRRGLEKSRIAKTKFLHSEPLLSVNTRKKIEHAKFVLEINGDAVIAKLIEQANIKFCLEKKKSEQFVLLCSPELSLDRENLNPSFVFTSKEVDVANIKINGEEMPLVAELKLDPKAEVNFRARLSNGMIFQFRSQAEPPEISEVFERDQALVIRGWGARPLGQVRDLGKPIRSFLERELRWQDTIGDFRQYWEFQGDRNLEGWSYRAPGGGIFTQKWKFDKLPKESWRPYLAKSVRNYTYHQSQKLAYWSPLDGEREWEYQAKQEQGLNRDYLGIAQNHPEFLGFYERDRALPGEMSARMTGVAGTENNLILMAEVAFAYWFESVLGWQNDFLSRHRWGLLAKYFKSLNNLKLGEEENPLQFSTIDFKYRLTPGLWGRHESWGVIAGVNQMKFGQFGSELAGLGFFWARSMPLVFDVVFSHLPFMNYPKWVDLEFIYYFSSLKSQTKPLGGNEGSGNWALNFHGKVFWTKKFFGEAGFGLKQIDFLQEMDDGLGEAQRIQFAFIYATAGLGWNF